MRYNFITIEGCIGAGKTSLSTKIATDFGGKLILEQFENNPFLPEFYKDPERHAFPVELYFMAERYQHLQSLLKESDLFTNFTVSDFLFQKSLIFALNNLNENEEKLYRTLFDIINPNLPKPDITIYLYASTDKLLQNIAKRGRGYEKSISGIYLEKIQQSYLNFFKIHSKQKVVIVDVTNRDFLSVKSDYDFILNILNSDYDTGTTFIK